MLNQYTTKQLATLLGKPVQTILNWAKKENWRGQRHQGRGGGMEWYTSTLPPKRHEQLTLALACRVATDNLSKQPCRAVNKGTAQSLTGIPEHGVRKAEARALIVNAVQHACEQGAAAPSVVMEDFAALFRKQQAPVPAWVYETLRGVSRCSIRLWIQQANKGGVRRLAKQHERRAPRNLVAQCPTLERFLVGMIEEFPHTSAVGLHEAAHARFGASGTAPDPAIKIPSVRRMQAWLRKWKEENEQLYSHILNPDAWRSGHKLALGDAAAHVVALNQEWQADSTQCDLMLNDGQRHTIVAMIDVYSRRVRFHVSRTSSAAAVASCFRKALLDWGVPDTLKTDNGSDYVSNHMKRIIHFLDIEHDVCPPFTPEHKPHVERVFKTFLHSHVELMQGYIGHNVAQRSDIEARKSFADRLFKKMQDREARVELAVSPEELQRIPGPLWPTEVKSAGTASAARRTTRRTPQPARCGCRTCAACTLKPLDSTLSAWEACRGTGYGTPWAACRQ